MQLVSVQRVARTENINQPRRPVLVVGGCQHIVGVESALLGERRQVLSLSGGDRLEGARDLEQAVADLLGTLLGAVVASALSTNVCGGRVHHLEGCG